MTASGVNKAMARRPMMLPTIAEVIAAIGPDWFMSKHDFVSAFMNLPIKQAQVDVCGVALPGGRFGRFRVCGFGGACFPRLNQRVSLEYRSALYRSGLTHACEIYVDDSVLASPSIHEAHNNDKIFLSLAERLGFRTATDKHIPPTQELEYTGFIINTHNRTLSLSADKCNKAQSRIHSVLQSYRDKGSVKFSDFSSMVGYLVHVSTVVPWGRIALRDLWDIQGKVFTKYEVGATKRKVPKWVRISLSNDACNSLNWWLET